MNINKLLTKPVIEDYNPSQVNNYYTLLEQLEFIKQLLMKYPAQQFFNVKNPLSDSATSVSKTSVITSGRQVNVGDILFVESSNDGALGLFKINSILETTYGIQYLGRITGTQDTEIPLAYISPVIYKMSDSILSGTTHFSLANTVLNRKPVINDLVFMPFASSDGVNCGGLVSITSVGTTSFTARVRALFTYPTTARDVYNFLEGSETIVADLNEDETAVELHLDNEINNKITNSLQKPATLAEDILVGCSTGNGSPVQTNVKIGSGLQFQNGTLSATGEVTAKPYYLRKSVISVGDRRAGLEFMVYILSSNNTIYNSYEDLTILGDDAIYNIVGGLQNLGDYIAMSGFISIGPAGAIISCIRYNTATEFSLEHYKETIYKDQSTGTSYTIKTTIQEL